MTIEEARSVVFAYRELETAAGNMRRVLLGIPGHERPSWQVGDLLQTVTCHPLVVYARGIDAGFTMGVIAGTIQAGHAGDSGPVETDIVK